MALPIGLDTATATIANNASLSGEVALGAKTIVGIAMPAAWTAAALSFQASIDGTTWLEMQTQTAAVSVTAAAGQYIAIDPAIWRGVNFVKVRSGTSGAPAAQGAERIVTLILKSVA